MALPAAVCHAVPKQGREKAGVTPTRGRGHGDRAACAPKLATGVSYLAEFWEKGNVVGLGGVKEPRKFNLVTALAKMINLYVWPHIYVAQQTSEKGRGAKLCAI